MHTTNQLLDALAEKVGGLRGGRASNYRLAKLLNVSSGATVRSWRRGRTQLSLDYALKVAHLLEWDPAYVIACVEKERAQKDARIAQGDELSAVWTRIAEKFRPAAASIVLALTAGAALISPSRSVAYINSRPSAAPVCVYYDKRRGRRGRRARRFPGTRFPALAPLTWPALA